MMEDHCKERLLEGKDALLKEQQDLEILAIDGIQWRTLFRCRKCGTYWEEIRDETKGAYMGGGVPVLRKVDQAYVQSQWKIRTK